MCRAGHLMTLATENSAILVEEKKNVATQWNGCAVCLRHGAMDKHGRKMLKT